MKKTRPKTKDGLYCMYILCGRYRLSCCREQTYKLTVFDWRNYACYDFTYRYLL